MDVFDIIKCVSLAAGFALIVFALVLDIWL